MSVLGSELQKLVRGEVFDSPDVLEKYARDASLFVVRPEVVVAPRDAEDVCKLVRFVTEKKKSPIRQVADHISLTARAAGTDMSGGPLGDSIVLDMTKHFTHIQKVESLSAVVESGVYFRDFDKETKKKNLELPSYTASRELCTVGGMVANNSGGEKNLKFGKTARWVKELDVVLSDGQVHTLGLLEGEALKRKFAEESFEGELYRKVSKLLSLPAHRKTIQEHKPTVEKNSSGYALWDIGDGITSLNLARLMVGAQGTLGIHTKITFGLVHPEPYSAMTIMFLNSVGELGPLVPEVLRFKPDSFESYDDHTFSLALKYLPELAAQMKAGLLRLGFSFIPELIMLLSGGIPKLVLMAEFRAHRQEDALAQAQALAHAVKKLKRGTRVRVARSSRAASKYWAVRRESFNLLRKKVRGKRTAPFIDDFVVSPRYLPEFLPKLEDILSAYPRLTYTIAGHVGDGNFHIIPLIDPHDPTVARTIDELSHKVYDLVLSYHGSITGEHNDGLVRTPYVEKMFGPAMEALFHDIKNIFDPYNIFNPGKKVGSTFSDTLAHLDLPVGKDAVAPSGEVV